MNNQPGVAIYLCSQTAPCTPAAFGTSPVVTDADVGGDGDTMPTPAPFLVDPLDPTQLLIGTCRVWRGPANGSGWSASNAISPILDSGATGVACNGDALIRSMAAMPLAGGGEIIYVGMYGSANDGANLPGHVLSAIFNPVLRRRAGVARSDPESGRQRRHSLNYYGLDISSIIIDPHDPTGNTVYVTVEGMRELRRKRFRSSTARPMAARPGPTSTANLPDAPANSLAVDPQNANTVYVATDAGVYFTTQVANCAQSACRLLVGVWTGLARRSGGCSQRRSGSASTQVLVAATYGRGIWQTPLWTAGTASPPRPPTPLRSPSPTRSSTPPAAADSDASQHRQPRSAAHLHFHRAATSARPTTA